MPALRATQPTGHEVFCLTHADHFIACGGRTPSSRSRSTFPTLTEAEAFAASFGDRRTMIYAVTAEGRSAHIKNACKGNTMQTKRSAAQINRLAERLSAGPLCRSTSAAKAADRFQRQLAAKIGAERAASAAKAILGAPGIETAEGRLVA